MVDDLAQPHDAPTGSFVKDVETLKRFVAAMPSLVLMLDDRWRIVSHSDRWVHLFAEEEPTKAASTETEDGGLPVEGGTLQTERPSFFEFVTDPEETWRSTFAEVLGEAESRRGYARPLTQPDGTTYWMDWEVRPWKDEEEEKRGVMVALTDRTGQHQAEVTRRQVEQRFDALIDTISEGVILMDRQGVFRDCNDAAQDILGRPSDDILGTRFDADIWNGLRADGTPLPNVQFPFWQAYVEREPIEDAVMGIYPPEAPPRWIRVNAQPLFCEGESDPYAVLICFDDVTEERLKEEALQTSRDLLTSVLSSSLDGIMVLSTVRNEAGEIDDFECVLVNPQAEKLMESTSDELIGGRLREVMPAQEEKGLFEDYCEVVKTGEPLETEVCFETDSLDGWFQVMAVRIDGGVAVTFRDVSERKEAAQAMAAANAKLERRNRALRDFAYVASHDLQEPLRKIRSFSNLVLEDCGEAVDDTGRHYLERMQSAAERMSQLINDLLVYSRVTTRAQPFEATDLEQIAQTVRNDLDLQIEEVGGTVEIGDLPTVAVDPTQVRQLIQNLVSNGLKFHKPDESPHVRVDATVERAPQELQQNGRLDASCARVCRLTVEDNGIGFEKKEADHIFTPFKRLHGRDEYAGTGMGLAICQRIVERHGGDITVTSAPGEGTTFTVLLPVDRSAGEGASGERGTSVPCREEKELDG